MTIGRQLKIELRGALVSQNRCTAFGERAVSVSYQDLFTGCGRQS
jgi:hypothetical protein